MTVCPCNACVWAVCTIHVSVCGFVCVSVVLYVSVCIHVHVLERQPLLWFAESDSSDQRLQNELSISVNNNDILLTVLPIIEKWVSQHAATPCSRVTVWASRNLAAHLNLPISCSPPAGLFLQALILGQDLPPVLLTVYDETDFEDNENGKKRAHDYAIQMVQKQSRLLMNFCSCEFVVVPCTIEKRILTPEILENEVSKQKQKTRSYYGGPHSLSEETYTKLKEAMTVLSAGSYVPCFLDESEKVTD